MRHFAVINDLRMLRRLVVITFAVVLVMFAAFVGYYYWDRYVHLGDITPIERNIKSLEQKAIDNPKDPDTRLTLAQFYLEKKMFPEAIAQANQILQAFPDNDGALFILGLSLSQSGQTEMAIDPLTKFADMHRKSADAQVDSLLEASLYYLGENYVTLSQADKAILVLTEALSINRTDADAFYQLGLAYDQQKQYDKAVEQYQKAALFVPDYIDVYNHMAESYTALSQPNYVVYARGMEAYARKDYNLALQDLQEAVKNLPDFVPAQLGLGLSYEQVNDSVNATRCYEAVLARDPNNFTAGQALARIKQKDSVN